MAKTHRKGSAKPQSLNDPHRRCIVHRQSKSPDEMIRFVLGPDTQVVPDLAGKLPGRGVWVTAERRDVETAIEQRLFSRAFKQSAVSDQNLGERIDAQLLDLTLKSFSLANKAGLVVTGFDKVLAALRDKTIYALIHASDGAEDGIRKIRQALTGQAKDRHVRTYRNLLSDEMSLALGRMNVVHAALKDGGASRNCTRNIERLTRYRTGMAVITDEIGTT